MCGIDDFSKGMMFAKAAEETSNFESEPEKEKKRKRKPVHHTPPESEGILLTLQTRTWCLCYFVQPNLILFTSTAAVFMVFIMLRAMI